MLQGPIVYGGKIEDRYKASDKLKVVVATATLMNKPEQARGPKEQAWNHSAEVRFKAGEDDKCLVGKPCISCLMLLLLLGCPAALNSVCQLEMVVQHVAALADRHQYSMTHCCYTLAWCDTGCRGRTPQRVYMLLQVSLSGNNMRFHGKSGYGGGASVQYSHSKDTTAAGSLQLNSERTGKINMRVTSHDHPKLGFSLLVPVVGMIWGKIRGRD